MRRAFVLSVPLLALLLTGCPSRPTVTPAPSPDIVVAQDGSGDYEEIMAAINAADPGDVILVKPGTYEEEVTIDKDRITLLGSGPDKTVIDADGEYAALSLSGDGCHIEGFEMTGGESHGVYVKDGHHTIRRCLVRGNDDRGIYLSSMFGDGSAVIEFCTIVDNDVSGIYSIKDHPKTQIRYCIIAGNGRGIVLDQNDGMMTIEYNVVNNDGEDFDRATEGTGNIVGDPRFVDEDDDNYRLKPNSPARNIDKSGNTAGCF